MTRYAPINKLRQRTSSGMGEFHAEQRELARMGRLGDEADEPPRHVVVIEDITRGLGLESDIAGRIQKAVSETNAEFTVKSQTQRLFHARSHLISILKSMKLDSDIRGEVLKRSVQWWKKHQQTEYDRKPQLRKALFIWRPPVPFRGRLDW